MNASPAPKPSWAFRLARDYLHITLGALVVAACMNIFLAPNKFVSRPQISTLKRLIADIDPEAFVVVSEAHEVLGDGFRSVSGH